MGSPLSWKQRVGLHAFEALYLGVLAVLPFVFAQRVVGLVLLIVTGTTILYFLVKMYLAKRIKVEHQGVLITGCDTGFGHRLAMRLNSLGFTVFAGVLNPKDEGAEILKSNSTGQLHVLKLDVTKEEDIKNALLYVEKHSANKGLWCLVNNAALNFVGDVEFCSMDMYRRVLDVNLLGMIEVTKTFLPLLRKSKGRVVNVTSAKGKLSLPSCSVYGISKYGGETFSDCLRLEMRKFGVKVVIIEPGNFGGATGMLSSKTLSWLRNMFDEMWEKSSDDVKETYGKDYLEALYNGTVKSASTSAKTVGNVIDAMEDAITSESPQIRYLVDGSKKLIDYNNFLIKIRPFIPDSFLDYLLDKEYNSGLPPVQANLAS
ncbi:hypothetical protein ACJMK2_035112 [Sinanodonta woodiana]|uniref:Uncharacterized protein n=1 Tax=Sinanodonta woodiana TaxID=1069815 RepID=A0ABD3WTU8_SINWO